jgi:hypothetical protein
LLVPPVLVVPPVVVVLPPVLPLVITPPLPPALPPESEAFSTVQPKAAAAIAHARAPREPPRMSAEFSRDFMFLS